MTTNDQQQVKRRLMASYGHQERTHNFAFLRSLWVKFASTLLAGLSWVMVLHHHELDHVPSPTLRTCPILLSHHLQAFIWRSWVRQISLLPSELIRFVSYSPLYYTDLN